MFYLNQAIIFLFLKFISPHPQTVVLAVLINIIIITFKLSWQLLSHKKNKLTQQANI